MHAHAARGGREPLARMSDSPARGFAANAIRGGAAAALFLALLFAAAEVALRVASWGDKPTHRAYPKKYFGRDSNGIPRAPEGRWRVVTTTSDTGETVYDVEYTIDGFGKRVTPVHGAQPREKFAMFFGCSYTMGEGVEDDETTAYYLGELAPAYMPVNYAFHGDDPFGALARLETFDFAAQVPQRSGVGFYVFLDDHVNRVNDSSSVASWHGNGPYYDLEENGRLVRNGSFRTARPLRSLVYRLVYESRVLRRLGLRLPLRVTAAIRGLIPNRAGTRGLQTDKQLACCV